METHEQFRAAAARLQAYRVDDATRRPAFTYRASEETAPRARVLRPSPLGRAAERWERRGVLTLSGAARRLADGAVSTEELVRAAYRAIELWNGRLNAFEHIVPEDEALRQSAAWDRIRGSGGGAVWGLPITVKDVIHVASLPTTASSRTLPNFVPMEDAEAVARLRRAGAIVIGKTTTHEYALGVTTPQSHNPWDLNRDPGGSSGGSAIAVATGMGLGSIGTDTRASIRVPAALCGVVGFKPTFGLVSTDGVVTLSWSMDHVAPMGRSVEDVALLLNVLVGRDPKDPGTVERPEDDYRRFVDLDVRGLRLGVPVHGLRGADPAVVAAYERALGALRDLGVVVTEVQEPTVEDFEMANAAGLIVSRCEALAEQRSLVGEEGPYTQDVREQLAEAAKIAALDYVQAQRFRGEFLARMRALLGTVDALAMPTSRVVAPPLAESDQYMMVLSENCVPWSFIGVPAVSVPCGLTPERLPVGIEFVGAPFDDGVLLTLGSAIEAALDVPVPPPEMQS
jgi:aspartyl-tRNA(Asn)/glutamyl-tRNA(Gln) amidotransferase subunit A